MKNRYIKIICLIIFLSSLSISKKEGNATFSDIQSNDGIVILKPSLANPIITFSGEEFDIIVRNVNDTNSPEIKLISDFINYTLMIVSITTSENDIHYKVRTENETMPNFYGLILKYSSFSKVTNNAVMIEENSLDNDVTIIHITDTHVDGTTIRSNQIQHLFSELNLIRPDFVILTGDLIEGLTRIDDQFLAGEEQFPIIVDLLNMFKVPVLIVNGNHDLTVNSYMNGIELWEQYFVPIDYILQFEYKDVIFAGISTGDLNGLTTDQLTSVKNILKESDSDLKFFFAHSDYDNGQFNQIYSQGGVDTSFLGHEHSGSIQMIDETTLEIVTDNAVKLNPNEPGHYRLCQVKNGILQSYTEIESEKLKSEIWSEEESEDSYLIEGWINNTHKDVNFSSLYDEITIKGRWKTVNIENASTTKILYNETHTRVIVEKVDVNPGIHSYKINLEKQVLIKNNSTSTIQTSPDSGTTAKNTPGFILGNSILICGPILKEMRNKGKKKTKI
jgi:predicted MPP superfamily phosphohydrolase